MRYLPVFLLLLGLTACGYHPPGQSGALSGGAKTVYIPLFVNRTTEPQLENHLTSMVSEVLARNGNLAQVESRDHAETVLEGVINSYRTRPLSYDKQDNISEYRSTMEVTASLRQVSDGRLLWQRKITWEADYPAANDKMLQEDLEQQAIDEISRRLAEELYYHLLDDF